MSELIAYGSEVTNIFQLIGSLENDITKSIAWAMCQCPVFMKKLIGDILQIDIDPEKVHIGNQEFEKDNGITDLEITDGEQFYIIIEAKRGWILPPENQLIMYSKRKGITQSGVAHKAIVSMSECSTEYANAGKGLELGIRCFSWNRTPG